MIHVSCLQNGVGRSGHQLKDLFTSIALAEIIGGEAVYNETWERQLILPAVGVRRELAERQKGYQYKIRYAPRQRYFGGAAIEDVLALKAKMEIFPGESEDVLLEIVRVFRIYPYQLHNWSRQGLIE